MLIYVNTTTPLLGIDRQIDILTAVKRTVIPKPICLRRQFYWTSLVRLSESIVSGGSWTILIILKNL
jgi:hypothetical protein